MVRFVRSAALPCHRSRNGKCRRNSRSHSVEPQGRARGGIVLVTARRATSAAGYCPRWEARGERVRCLARRPEALRSRVALTTEIVAGDIATRRVDGALDGVRSAYYLIHAMDARGDFARRRP
jgi:uncharacterized protein YbjT (DUF2867 family)